MVTHEGNYLGGRDAINSAVGKVSRRHQHYVLAFLIRVVSSQSVVVVMVVEAVAMDTEKMMEVSESLPLGLVTVTLQSLACEL